MSLRHPDLKESPAAKTNLGSFTSTPTTMSPLMKCGQCLGAGQHQQRPLKMMRLWHDVFRKKSMVEEVVEVQEKMM